jgi:hypothetical protein
MEVFRGNTCPLGNYYFSIQAKGVNGERKDMHGTLMLLR